MIFSGRENHRLREELDETKRQLADTRERLKQRNRRIERLLTNATAAPTDALYYQVGGLLSGIEQDFGGGCSVGKAYVLSALIREYSLQVTVDIGVYKGRSLFPQAIAHREHSGGVVFGVDPWSAEEAREEDNPDQQDAIDRFVESTDFGVVYEQVRAFCHKSEVQRHCVLLRKTSAEAASSFGEEGRTFGLVHIDGNHDTARVLEDVGLYIPLLAAGGFMVLDDVSWDSVKPALREAADRLTPLFERTLGQDDYAVLWNGEPGSADGPARFLEQTVR